MRTWQTRAWRDSETHGPITVHLRWTRRSATAAKGRWQVTTLEPPPSIRDWENPPGLVASGDVGRLSETGELDVSFTPAVPASGLSGSGDQPIVLAPLRPRLERREHSTDAPPMVPKIKIFHFAMARPNRFFVRIVGLDAQEQPVGRPSTSIIVDWTPQTLPHGFKGFWSAEEIRRKQEEAAKKAEAARIARLSLTFTPRREQASDSFYRYVVTADVPMMGYRLGQKIKLQPKSNSDNWLDDVCDALGDAVSFLGDSVNWISHAWKDIKTFAVDGIADVIPDPKLRRACQMALATGLDAGLAAMGVPPSIPNFDQLAQAGKGYLVQTLAEQASEAGAPIPPQAVEAVVDRTFAAAKKHADGGGGEGGWLRHDPDFMYRPAIATVTITSQSPAVIRDHVLTVEFNRLYYRRQVPLPPIPPGGQLSVPVVLESQNLNPWILKVAEDRRRSGRHDMVSYTDAFKAWWTSYNGEENFLWVALQKESDDPWHYAAYTSASFVAAKGFSG